MIILPWLLSWDHWQELGCFDDVTVWPGSAEEERCSSLRPPWRRESCYRLAYIPAGQLMASDSGYWFSHLKRRRLNPARKLMCALLGEGGFWDNFSWSDEKCERKCTPFPLHSFMTSLYKFGSWLVDWLIDCLVVRYIWSCFFNGSWLSQIKSKLHQTFRICKVWSPDLF